MDKIKIAYFHHYPLIVGSAISLSNLIKELNRQIYEPIVVLAQEGPVRGLFEAIGVRVVFIQQDLAMEFGNVPIWSRQWYRNWSAFRPNQDVERFLRDENIKIVHLNDSPLISAGITAYQIGIPIVWHIRGVIPQDGSFRKKLLVKKIAELSAMIVAIREPDAMQFGGIPNIRVIYNSANIEAIEAARNTGYSFRAEINCDPETKIISAITHVSQKKGAWDFIQAAGLTKLAHPRMNLRFILAGHIQSKSTQARMNRLWDRTGFLGKQHPLDYAMELASRVGVKENLVITGFRNDVLSVIDASDIIVYPGIVDRMGRAVIEGSLLGKPVIATTPECGYTDMMINGKTGLFVPPSDPVSMANAFTQLLSNPTLMQEMGVAGRTHALQKFDSHLNIIPIHQIYEEILQSC